MNKYIDLHIHTVFSDGIYTPEQVVIEAKKRNLKAISITDHDNTLALNDAIRYGEKYKIEIIPGIELSVEFNKNPEHEMHIVGYFIDYTNEELQKKLEKLRQYRKKRAFKIFEKLSKIGIRLNEKEIFSNHEKNSIGRLHFAKQLLKENYVKNIKEAFNKYLGYNKCAYVPKMRITAEEAIMLIQKTGGISVIAHPYYGNYVKYNILSKLIKFGLKGIEVWHPGHSEFVKQKYYFLAKKLGLLITGGSDYHGFIDENKSFIGIPRVPYHILENLKKMKNG